MKNATSTGRHVSIKLLIFVFLPLMLVATIASARKDAAFASTWVDPPWQWPTGHPVSVARAFDPPTQPWLAGHRGVDLEVAVGSTVLAPASGRVVFAGNLAGRPVVSVEVPRSTGAIRATFEPVDPTVETGQWVDVGQVLGTVVDGHHPGALHWGAKISSTQYVDPLRLLSPPVVLKPW